MSDSRTPLSKMKLEMYETRDLRPTRKDWTSGGEELGGSTGDGWGWHRGQALGNTAGQEQHIAIYRKWFITCPPGAFSTWSLAT